MNLNKHKATGSHAAPALAVSPTRLDMTPLQATAWVVAHQDTDTLDGADLERAFAAIFERPADDDDRTEGLWSLLCAATEGYRLGRLVDATRDGQA